MSQYPDFYDPARIGTLFHPDLDAIVRAADAGLPPADRDRGQAHLLLIDMQVDFCHPGGSLFVPGAVEDIRRVIEFIFRNAARITRISGSLDSHLPFQIFHPGWWSDRQGRPPEPFTVIRAGDVRDGVWRPRFQPRWSQHYVERLNREARKELTIWPYHVPIGGVGGALDPELWSAVFWHALARRSQPRWWPKGDRPETEHYSILGPEVAPREGRGDGEDILQLVRSSDRVFVAGEAASHCVLETLEDFVEAFSDTPDVLGRIHVLRDCTSPVQHPEIDFRALTEERFAEFEKAGVRFALSTDPLI